MTADFVAVANINLSWWWL